MLKTLLLSWVFLLRIGWVSALLLSSRSRFFCNIHWKMKEMKQKASIFLLLWDSCTHFDDLLPLRLRKKVCSTLRFRFLSLSLQKKTHQFELLWLRYNNYVLGATTYATALWDGKFIETTFCALPGASVWKHIHWHISWACEYISSPTDRVYYTHFKAPKGRSSIFSLTSCSSDPQNPNSFFLTFPLNVPIWNRLETSKFVASAFLA